MGAAGPVLDELAIRLEGTTFCVALADSTCRIVDRQRVGVLTERAAEFGQLEASRSAADLPLSSGVPRLRRMSDEDPRQHGERFDAVRAQW
ncbi:hypothetical protein [Saccharopolyspora spinosa]|uniref:hypothetical protein n=1 Tax=Saccharopolyspora spinosa TaxID=60894 RepID=UPI0002379DF4|nr:hypothetical protein [Saccharopolyspora spinosa]